MEEEGGGELLSVIRTTFDSNVATFWGGALLARHVQGYISYSSFVWLQVPAADVETRWMNAWLLGVVGLL